jgi:hypothetical protein
MIYLLLARAEIPSAKPSIVRKDTPRFIKKSETKIAIVVLQQENGFPKELWDSGACRAFLDLT